jgi:hypothetical protein
MVFEFEDFELETQDGETVSFASSIRADFVRLPTADLKYLQNQGFDFPINPDDGYIDASVYFCHAHNPVDISRIEFGAFEGDAVRLKVFSRWLMEFEGTGFNDFDYEFSTLAKFV